MTLAKQWKEDKGALQGKQLRQILAFAGDGRLRDESDTSREFREFLRLLPSTQIEAYVAQCLEEAFPDSGLALQDIVNEIGRRLGFQVEFGRYRGKSGEAGHDGLWRLADGSALVVEVKTTDAYRIDLDRIGDYRRKIAGDQELVESRTSALLVVGRTDTGDLEAQVRGSRHAWEMRLISCDALVRLLKLKEELEDPATLHRIHQLLFPREFTKLDAIVDLMFSTAEDTKQAEPHFESEIVAPDSSGKKFVPVSFHDGVVALAEASLGLKLVKLSRATFEAPDADTGVICLASREHDRGSFPYYWFAYHKHQRDYLLSRTHSYLALGCGSADDVLIIPARDLEAWVPGMNKTATEDREYWHLQIGSDGKGSWFLIRRAGQPRIDLNAYVAVSTGSK